MPKQTDLIPSNTFAVKITYADGETDHAFIRDGMVDFGPSGYTESIGWMVTWARLWKTNRGRARDER
jgi:hypothetical protein